jgi:hypothetical protein
MLRSIGKSFAHIVREAGDTHGATDASSVPVRAKLDTGTFPDPAIFWGTPTEPRWVLSSCASQQASLMLKPPSR